MSKKFDLAKIDLVLSITANAITIIYMLLHF